MSSQIKSRIRMSSTCERDADSAKYVPVIRVVYPSNSVEHWIVRGASFFKEAAALGAASSHIKHIASAGLAPWHMPELFVKQGAQING